MSHKHSNTYYSGVTDNPDTWGMCCSKRMAQRCEKEYYKQSHKSDKSDKFIICLGFIVVIAVIIFASIIANS